MIAIQTNIETIMETMVYVVIIGVSMIAGILCIILGMIELLRKYDK